MKAETTCNKIDTAYLGGIEFNFETGDIRLIDIDKAKERGMRICDGCGEIVNIITGESWCFCLENERND